jgi:serine/threonine protein kinase
VFGVQLREVENCFWFIPCVRLVKIQVTPFLQCQDSLQGLREALREVSVLGSYRHPHLVPLVCFSLSRQGGLQEACLVYPLMTGGALDSALADRSARVLTAAARLRIAADAAAGLAYLHAPGGGLGALLHRDVKSSNVLLDEGLRARIADVGLARPLRGATMTAGVGTWGYLDPSGVFRVRRAIFAQHLELISPAPPHPRPPVYSFI